MNHWKILLPVGPDRQWDGTSTVHTLGRQMIQATDGTLINPDHVVSMTPVVPPTS